MNSTGDGSRRRVRQFRIGSDTFADLRTGEAVIYSVHAHPTRVMVDPLTLPGTRPAPLIGSGPRHRCDIRVDASTELPEPGAQPKRKPTAPKRKRTPAKPAAGGLTPAVARVVPAPAPQSKPPADPSGPAVDVDLGDV
jgi:hypothetical protein